MGIRINEILSPELEAEQQIRNNPIAAYRRMKSDQEQLKTALEKMDTISNHLAKIDDISTNVEEARKINKIVLQCQALICKK